MADKRSAAFVGVALALHVAAIAMLPHHAPKRAPITEMEIVSLDVEGSSVGTAHAKAKTGADVNGNANARATIHEHARTITTPSGTSEVEIEPAATSTSTSESPSLYVQGSIGLDGPGSYRMQMAREQPDESAIAKDDVNHAIMDPIHEHERLNGSLGDGPIVLELEKTTRQLEGTPFEGRAVFAVRVDALGLVVSVGVDESSSDRRAWEDVATKAFNALAQKRVRIPAGSKGLAMRIEVSSKVVLPSGARSHLSVSSPAAEALAHIANGQFDHNAESPGILGGTFDLSDIGAHKLRVVGARVLSENVY